MNDVDLAPAVQGDAALWAELADASLFDESAELLFLDRPARSATDEHVSWARTTSGAGLMRSVIDDAVSSQTMVNLEAARQLFAIGRAFEYARTDPSIYVPVGATEKDPRAEEVDFAVRAVAFDLAQWLHLSENTVRSMAWQADVLNTSLPRLKELFTSGRISPQHVRAAVESCTGLPDEAAYAMFDERMAGIVEKLNPGVFARRCRLLRERLCADTLPERHEEAHTRRRVVVEAAADAMAWLNLHASVLDIAQIEVALTAEARRLRALPGETRTLDQVRADLAVQWLKGDTTGAGTHRRGRAGVRPFVLIDDAGRFAELLGYGPIPPKQAAAALRDAPSFRKVLADPIRPAVLNLDTTRYRPTPDQKTWLTLTYGLDEEAAPYVPVGIVSGAEIDHVIERQHGGPTDVGNLAPFKPRLHRMKTVTRIRLDPKPDGGIRVRTPTGYDSDPPPF
ncbi:DUF222 domain-containing protein [Humibacter sp.]|uniref:HNH endonuclease signature motif containing protein n=1 Tax=Humibacter sp. TaxID=1940291 RepID=UPI003F8196DB